MGNDTSSDHDPDLGSDMYTSSVISLLIPQNCHFIGKPVVALQNISYFLRLEFWAQLKLEASQCKSSAILICDAISPLTLQSLSNWVINICTFVSMAVFSSSSPLQGINFTVIMLVASDIICIIFDLAIFREKQKTIFQFRLETGQTLLSCNICSSLVYTIKHGEMTIQKTSWSGCLSFLHIASV